MGLQPPADPAARPFCRTAPAREAVSCVRTTSLDGGCTHHNQGAPVGLRRRLTVSIPPISDAQVAAPRSAAMKWGHVNSTELSEGSVKCTVRSSVSGAAVCFGFSDANLKAPAGDLQRSRDGRGKDAAR